MTRDEKLVLLTELVKEDAITLDEAFGLFEETETETETEEEEEDEEKEDEEKEDEEKEITDIIEKLQSVMKEINENVKKGERKEVKTMTFTQWLMERQKEAK